MTLGPWSGSFRETLKSESGMREGIGHEAAAAVTPPAAATPAISPDGGGDGNRLTPVA